MLALYLSGHSEVLEKGQKMNPNKLLASAALVVGFAASAPLSAAVVQVQYTGTVSSGFDQTGVFGSANSFLDGSAYTASYTFETTNGIFISNAAHNYAYGGTAYSVASPALSSTITINGNTVSISGNYFGQIFGQNSGTFSQVYHHATDYVTSGSSYYLAQMYNSVFNYSNTLPYSLTGPLSYSVTAGDTSYGYMSIENYSSSFDGYTEYAYVNLTPDHVTISAPIPEPETYAMLLAGLGLLGFAARRRKSKLPA